MKQTGRIVMTAALLAVMATGCDVDKNNPKYDQLRYDQLQKSRCVDMATLLSAKLVNASPEDYDKALKRCEDMKSLSFEEYKRLADDARATGTWDVYRLYPEKKNPQK